MSELLIVLAVLFGILMLLSMASTSSSSGRRSRLDTPSKAIDRTKRRYIHGERDIEWLEDRVYQIVPTDGGFSYVTGDEDKQSKN